jgi:hypothetical protein
MRAAIVGIVLGLTAQIAVAGPYAPAAGQTGSTAIRYDDPSFVAWGSAVGQLTRGPQDISDPESPLATYGNPQTAPIGPADAFDPITFQPLTDPSKVLSLGDGGSITILFANPICDGPGADFAVFENAFNSTFLELAFVWVFDGTNWAKFPSHSLTQTSVQIDQSNPAPYNGIDPTDIDGLAGKYQAGYGTPFDLSILSGTGLDLNHITAVKIVDVVGSIDPAYATYDSAGNMINDPWPTPFPSSGFDLDAIGVIHVVPEPSCFFGVLIGAGYAFSRRRQRR